MAQSHIFVLTADHKSESFEIIGWSSLCL